MSLHSPHHWEVLKAGPSEAQLKGEPPHFTDGSGLGCGAASPGSAPPASLPLVLPGCSQTAKQGQTNLNPSMPRVDGRSGTTRSPFFSSKVVMCSRKKPNLGCFGPKETFTTKLYISENKWAFILEGNPARLFIICTTIIKLVLISVVECRWLGQLAGSGGLSGDHFTLRTYNRKQREVLLLKYFSQDPSFLFSGMLIATSKHTPFLVSLFLYSHFWKFLGLPERGWI